MSSQAENAKLFQKVVVFKYVEDTFCQPKEILMKRQAVTRCDVRGVLPLLTRGPANTAAGQAAVTTAAGYFDEFDDASEEIFFMCMPHAMEYRIEISPDGWAETLPSFNVIEVWKRPKRAAREQVLSGPME